MQEAKKQTIRTFHRTYLLPFSILFIVIQFLVFAAFYLNHKTLIWSYDGAYQHYPALSYYSNLLKNLLSGKGLPMVDFSIGLGFDVLTSLNYYVIGDPLTLLSDLVRSNQMEFFYSFLILFRMYLAGTSFLIFCVHKKKTSYASLLGALIYVFSSYALFAGLKHPFFLNPMIYLPLLLLAVDRLLEKKKGLMLSAMVALCAMSNFYFLYILTILTVIYAIVRFFELSKNKRILDSSLTLRDSMRSLVRTFLHGAGCYLLGIGIASALLLPTIYAFLHNGRLATGGEAQSLLHFSYSYYRHLPQILFTFGTGSGNWTLIGIGVLAALCTIPAIFESKKWNAQKTFLLLCFIGFCVPFAGKLMNGMSTVSNRWCFALTFLLSYFIADHYETLFIVNKKRMIWMCSFTGLYVLYAIFLGDKYVRIPTLILVLMLAVIVLSQKFSFNKRYRDTAILVLTIANLCLSGNLFFSSKGMNFSNDFLAYGEIKNYTECSAASYLPSQSDGFYRVQDTLTTSPNLGLTSSIFGSSYYLSIMDEHVLDAMTSLENSSLRFACQFFSFDKRAYLQSLNSVKYLIADNFAQVPYGYQLYQTVDDGDSPIKIYENKYALPLGFTYDTYLTREEYDALTPLQKQEAMMQCVVLPSACDGLSQGTPKYHISPLTATLNTSDSLDTPITYEDGLLTVPAAKSKLSLSFLAPAKSELYLYLNEFDISSSGRTRIYVRTLSNQKKYKNFTTFQSRLNNYYFGEDSILLNLGYSKTKRKHATMSVEQTGTYNLGSLELYAQSMKPLSRYYKARTKTVLENVAVTTNKITGTISSDESKLLLLSIPYSKGWTAYVDGKKSETLCANLMYTGLMITPGTHTVTLRYRTPYLIPGLLVSLISIAGFVVLVWRSKLKNAKTEIDKIQS